VAGLMAKNPYHLINENINLIVNFVSNRRHPGKRGCVINLINDVVRSSDM